MQKFANRAVGAASRRLGRPELLAAVDAGAARELYDEIAMRAVLASALRENAVYVDVGTNRGQILREAVRVAPNGTHIAFEPIPELAAVIRKTFPDIECHEKAVSFEAGSTSFCHFTTMDGWSGLRRRREVSDAVGRPAYITVDVVVLDDALRDRTPTVVKIDVEGAELNVLRGATRMLAEDRPLVLFEHERASADLYEASSEQLWQLLSGAGYRIFTVTGAGPVPRASFADAQHTVNWLAVPV